MAIKIFIVDDHYMVIEGIKSLLYNEPGIEWMGHATNADSCLAFLKNNLPDIILMDINLPDISGIDLCKTVVEDYPSVYIIGLSTFNQTSFINKMMENGASGYVLKNASQTELMEAIKTVSSGKKYLSFDVSKKLKEVSETDIVITRREREVLQLIAEGMTNNSIAEKLFVSTSTVDTHRKNLLIKFNAPNTASLVHTAMQLKFID